MNEFPDISGRVNDLLYAIKIVDKRTADNSFRCRSSIGLLAEKSVAAMPYAQSALQQSIILISVSTHACIITLVARSIRGV